MNQNVPGNNTPDFTGNNAPDFRSPQFAAPNEEPTVTLPSGQYGTYTGADFPAPPGVRPLTPNGAPTTVVQRPKRRTGALIVGAALAAVLGAGAGVGSYAYLSDGQTGSPVNVTSAAPPSPTLNGTVTAAAAKIEPS